MFLLKYKTIKGSISPLHLLEQYFYFRSPYFSLTVRSRVIQDVSVCVQALIAALWHVHFTKVKCAAVAA